MGAGSRTGARLATLACVFGVIAACGSTGTARVATHRGHRSTPTGASCGALRRYYIAADTVDWDYAPTGRNGVTGEDFDDDANVFVEHGPHRIGRVYRKSLYREYTDRTFTTLKPRPAKWKHLGTLGPMIQAEVGDIIKITFRNNTPFPASMHPHGVFYAKSSEGAPYADGTSGADADDDAVPPGGTHTYVWKVPERAGPGPMDGSTALWMYHSHTDEVADTYAGLVGPMVVTRKGMARPDGSPRDVDREFVTMYEVDDENQSLWIHDNIEEKGDGATDADLDDEEFGESNLMHSINGFVYGNIPGLSMRVGDRVRWYVLGMGTEVDLHTPHWHGNTVTAMGMRTDVVQILPGGMVTADMTVDNPGTWLMHCHVNDHILAGMIGLYTVTS